MDLSPFYKRLNSFSFVHLLQIEERQAINTESVKIGGGSSGAWRGLGLGVEDEWRVGNMDGKMGVVSVGGDEVGEI